MTKYIRIIGENGTYVFSEEEIEKALDRENEGVNGEVVMEKDFYYLANPKPE